MKHQTSSSNDEEVFIWPAFVIYPIKAAGLCC